MQALMINNYTYLEQNLWRTFSVICTQNATWVAFYYYLVKFNKILDTHTWISSDLFHGCYKLPVLNLSPLKSGLWGCLQVNYKMTHIAQIRDVAGTVNDEVKYTSPRYPMEAVNTNCVLEVQKYVLWCYRFSILRFFKNNCPYIVHYRVRPNKHQICLLSIGDGIGKGRYHTPHSIHCKHHQGCHVLLF